jgi:hypothetical protein
MRELESEVRDGNEILRLQAPMLCNTKSRSYWLILFSVLYEGFSLSWNISIENAFRSFSLPYLAVILR